MSLPTCFGNRVVPFFERHGAPEYCGNRENHEYEPYPAVGDIGHSKVKTESPQRNGICERFNRTVQNESYAVAFRKKIHTCD